jgi:hypothetical protein
MKLQIIAKTGRILETITRNPAESRENWRNRQFQTLQNWRDCKINVYIKKVT